MSTALQKFMKDPEKFLRKNAVTVAGGNRGRAAGPTRFCFGPGPGDDLGKFQRKGRVHQVLKPCPDYRIGVSDTNGGNLGGDALRDDEFIAYYIPMKNVTTEAANMFGRPPMDGSLDLLITSQLSGCTFGFSAGGGQCMASHVEPRRGAASADEQRERRREMADKTQRIMDGAATLVEQGRDYRDLATIVGKFSDKRWHLFVQQHDLHFSKGPTVYELSGVTKL